MPPGKDLRIGVSGDTSKYERAIDRAKNATEGYRDSLTSLELTLLKVERELHEGQVKAAREAEQAMRKQQEAGAYLGRGMLVAGAAIGVGLGMAAKSAIEWESAWAGVTKVVDGSPEEMAALEGELRDLANVLPATHTEIAAVAEAAGQLGIQRQNIASFTRTMIAMGVSTNLSAEEASTGMARFANIMGTAQGDADKLGSAIVALGNDGASTERDILDMSLRIAAAGKVAGFTESQVLAIANSLSSLGIEAEAGGSAISTIMVKIDKAVADSGDELAAFADIAGMSAREFATQWAKDPAKALLAFEAGLAGVEEQGGNTFAVLEDLGITEIRQRGAVLALAQGHDLLADSLETGADAWADNAALMTEANKRYETAESKIAIARNQLNDLGIDIGGVLLPALSAAVEGLGDLAGWFGDLPGPVKTALTILGSAGAALALTGGAALVAVPKIAELSEKLTDLGIGGDRTSRSLRGLAKAAAIAPVIVALAAAIDPLMQAMSRSVGTPISTDIDAMSRALLRLGHSGKISGELAKTFGDDFEGVTRKFIADGDSFGEVANRLANATWADKLESGFDAGAKSLAAMDDSLATLVERGFVDQAAAAFDKLAAEADDYGVTQAQLLKLFPEYTGAVDGLAITTEIAADAQEKAGEKTKEYGELTGEAAQEVEDLTAEANELLDALNATSDINLKVLDTEIAFREGIRELKDQISGKSDALYASEKATRAEQAAVDENRSALDDMIGTAKDAADAVYDKTLKTQGAEAAGKAWDRVMSANIGTLLKEADELGLNERQTREYIAAILGIPVKALTRYSAANLATILGQANALDATADKLDGREVETTFVNRRVNIIETRRPSLPWFGVEERAHGGPLEAGRLSWVGEAGPELVMFDQDVTVIPHAKSRQIASSAESLSLSSAKHGGRLASPSTASSTSAAPAPITINMRSVDLDERRLAHVQRVAAIHERIGTGRPT